MVLLPNKGHKIERQTTIPNNKFVHGLHSQPPVGFFSELTPPPFFKSLTKAVNSNIEV